MLVSLYYCSGVCGALLQVAIETPWGIAYWVDDICWCVQVEMSTNRTTNFTANLTYTPMYRDTSRGY